MKNKQQKNIEMKDSGIDWIGIIPSEWNILPMRASLKERKKKNIGNKITNILSVMKDVGVIRYEDKGNVGNKSSSRPESYKIVYPNDIVANSMNLVIGSVGISRELGVTSSVYLIYYAKNESINIDYFSYLFRTKPFQKHLGLFGRGIMELRESIKQQDIKVQLVPTPPKQIQENIVRFLDKKTGNISKLVEKKKSMIELLKEKRSSVITHAVTKGLDSNVKMKNSGIDRISEIPNEWYIRRLFALGHFSKGFGIARKDLSEEGFPAVLYGDIYTRYNIQVFNLERKIPENISLRSKKINKEDILFAGSGETKEDIGKNFVYLGDQEAFAGGDILVFKQNKNNSLFLSYALDSKVSRAHKESTSNGEIIIHTTASKLKNLRLAVPPIETQQNIVNFLNEKTSEIDNIISKIGKQIQLLDEYKSSLIYHAVTGKIKEIL